MNAAQFRAGYGAAEEIARKAIQVAPQSRRGYAALGEILDQQLKRRAAFVQFRKMLALSGEEGRTLPIYATFLSEIGRSGEALQAGRPGHRARSTELSILRPESGDSGERETIHRRYPSPGKSGLNCRLASKELLHSAPIAWRCPAERRRHVGSSQPLLAIQRTRRPDGPHRSSAAAQTLLSGSDSLAGLRESTGDGAPYQYAQIYAQLGEEEEALDALQKAWDVRDPGLTTMLVDPLLDPVRNEPRFRDILRLIDNPT